ncbi:RsfA family transcriptional regulator [Bacillus sp. ISL-40]|uniref:RsfA family transcriptional regulator n=1 Tax=unclassified Bacillus (in: firmicutes) TaxID=185979 RepID=UPI001BE9B279|nr:MULTISPECIES: RsfA family transcriptional regulator [unclassified Bacillus (in: firmicutes)]MBT2696952.1 RsfA family transcriptional regulator [Bacillus sp. ISL-40]MBT2719764.1 RsfA family transcriptional regulator [Bacillus sp. ISL-46]MBT2742444.1 RsfA family transcriptional regulator [Bacillus sp. ISL-77]
MKVRQDAWTDENDLLLAETVLRHVREGSTQLNAFEEVGDKLNRTSAACGFRWNAVVRHRYEKALQLAKKQRKQRQRVLGKDQGGKKKLLYSPPLTGTPEFETMPMEVEMPLETSFELPDMTAEMAEETYVKPAASVQTQAPVQAQAPVQPSVQTYRQANTTGLSLDSVITYLQNFHHANLQNEALKSENERLKRELAEVRRHNEEMSAKIAGLEQNTETIQEDYETLMKIMNRARKLVLFEEEERPATKFKMDRNGNLEKVAE